MTNAATRGATIAANTATNSNTAALVGGLLKDLARATEFSVEAYGALTTNTGAANDIAFALAITDALAVGGQLYWPAGTFLSAASITGLHTVKHRGPGAIQRGSDVFYVDPTYGKTNVIYVDPAGGSTNDGLTAAQPMTLNAIVAPLYNYGPTLNGTWRAQLAAGTYAQTTGITFDGLRSVNPIQFKGPVVGASPAVPTAIIDGTGTAPGTFGLYFREYMQVQLQDIKIQNYGAGNAIGLQAERFSFLQTYNVHTTGCDQAGIGAEAGTRLLVSGGIHAGNKQANIRAYGQCHITIGYTGSAGANRVTIGATTTGGSAGIVCRDNSSGHVDYTDINGVIGSTGGIYLLNQSRLDLVDVKFGQSVANYYNIRCDGQSTFIDNPIAPCTYGVASSGKSIVEFGFSLDNASLTSVYYDNATGFFRFGRVDDVVPLCRYSFSDSVSLKWLGSFNSNVLASLSVGGASGSPYLGFGAGATGVAGIMWASPTVPQVGQLDYNFTSNYVRLRVNSIDSYTWYQDNSAAGYYRPEVTGANAPTLGDASHGWRAIFIGATPVKVSTGAGSPAGVVSGSPGDIYLNTSGGAATTLYVKESGAATTAGWVAK